MSRRFGFLLLFFHYDFDLRTLINPHIKDLKGKPWDVASDEEMLPACFWKSGELTLQRMTARTCVGSGVGPHGVRGWRSAPPCFGQQPSWRGSFECLSVPQGREGRLSSPRIPGRGWVGSPWRRGAPRPGDMSSDTRPGRVDSRWAVPCTGACLQ